MSDFPVFLVTAPLPDFLFRDFIRLKMIVPRMDNGKGEMLEPRVIKLKCPLSTRISTIAESCLTAYNSSQTIVKIHQTPPSVQNPITGAFLTSVWTFKVAHTREYLLPKPRLESFQCVRLALRESDPSITLMLIPMPTILSRMPTTRASAVTSSASAAWSSMDDTTAIPIIRYRAFACPHRLDKRLVHSTALPAHELLGELPPVPTLYIEEPVDEDDDTNNNKTAVKGSDDTKQNEEFEMTLPPSLQKMMDPVFNALECGFDVKMNVPPEALFTRNIDKEGDILMRRPMESAYRLVPISMVSAPVRLRINYASLLDSLPQFARSHFILDGRAQQLLAMDGHYKPPERGNTPSGFFANHTAPYAFIKAEIWHGWSRIPAISNSYQQQSQPQTTLNMQQSTANNSNVRTTRVVPVDPHLSGLAVWDQTLVFPLAWRQVPREAVLVLSLYGIESVDADADGPLFSRGSKSLIAHVTFPIFNADDTLPSWKVRYSMWPAVSGTFKVDHLKTRGGCRIRSPPVIFGVRDILEADNEALERQLIKNSGNLANANAIVQAGDASSALCARQKGIAMDENDFAGSKGALFRLPLIEIQWDSFDAGGVLYFDPCLDGPSLLGSKRGQTELGALLRDLDIGESSIALQSLTAVEKNTLERVLNFTPLVNLSSSERQLLIQRRNAYSDDPSQLYKLACAINYSNRFEVRLLHDALSYWAPLGVLDALPLLSGRFADRVLRDHAVRELMKFSDEQLSPYIVQFVQSLKHELYEVMSPLQDFLIERAIKSPVSFGHALFWALRSEINDQRYMQRFTLILETILSLQPLFAMSAQTEMSVINLLMSVACTARTLPSASRDQLLRKQLSELNGSLPRKFPVCIDLRRICRRLIPENCKVMSSKKRPLWIVFEGAEGASGVASTNHAENEGLLPSMPLRSMFKVGDDLRQDVLTLQLFRILDEVWLYAGLDLRVRWYNVVATGDMSGLLQIVSDAKTTSEIQKGYGGKVMGAFRSSVIDEFLTEMNPSPEAKRIAIDNFVRSCAGCCVATYCLGIGDRHASNIMVHKDGTLFHIDFGHFLGNFKSKFGIKRERAPFVFTPEMAFVMGGVDAPDFNKFLDLCAAGFNVMRGVGRQLIGLFVTMLSAEMPELQSPSDILYLRDMLQLDLNEQEAAAVFKTEVFKSVRAISRRIDNLFHNIK